MRDQTRRSRAAVDAMWPARWDDIAWCDVCGSEVDPTEAHSPHATDCPMVTFGADVCRCDLTVCPACCAECVDGEDRAMRAVAWLIAAAVAAAVLSIWLIGPDDERACPDARGACVFVGDT